jgi:RNA 2',3'-cyclic 3'-phosphodiesterase
VVSGPPTRFGLYFLIFPDVWTATRIAALAHHCRSEYGLSAKPLLTSRFHISLQNLGEYDEMRTPENVAVKARAAAANVKMSPFAVMFDRVESFSGRKWHYPLVLRGDDGVVGLEILYRSLGVAMRRAGLKPRLDFAPHLTLLYDNRRLEERFVEPIKWTVREFTLVLSLRGQTIYRPLGQWQLSG